MEEHTRKQHLEEIRAFVFDENMIVTYKWLSNTLQIHVNTAKQLLYSFVSEEVRDKKKPLAVTYLISGILPNNKGCRLQVVEKDAVDEIKSQFKVVTSEHIYSVGTPELLSKIDACLSVDKTKDNKHSRHAAIRCEKSILRNKDDITSKREQSLVVADDGKQWPTEAPKQSQTTSEPTKTQKDKPKSASGSITSMFAAQTNNAKVTEMGDSKIKKDKISDNSKESAQKPGNKNLKNRGGPLAAMFLAQSSAPKPQKKEAPKEEKNAKEEIVEEIKEEKKPDHKTTEETTNQTNNVAEKDTRKVGNKTEVKNSKKKKRNVIRESDKGKKRRRIVLIQDSDSSDDDIFDREESPERSPSPPEPEESEKEEVQEVSLSESEKKLNQKSGRKGRWVDKTFLDKDGFLVTKKEYVFESCSGSENEGEKENEKKENKIEKTEVANKKQKIEDDREKKISQPEKKKQATLMNFFKRS